mgnify:CR=1 FL=1
MERPPGMTCAVFSFIALTKKFNDDFKELKQNLDNLPFFPERPAQLESKFNILTYGLLTTIGTAIIGAIGYIFLKK